MMVGKNFSHYKILEELGRGGMGIVYKAEDTKLDRIVAIKVLPSAALASEGDRARFYREAKAAAQLHHPHIASIFEIDEAVPEGSPDDDPRPFIAMEYIEGATLDEKIQEGPLPLKEAVRIASEISLALQAAHKKDIVHRDIKSQNVMLTGEGSAKVLDFGLAQTAHSTKLTQAGSTLGTIAYMSPEQARGEEVDQRTDVWSVGVVLYEMISGRVAFPGEYEQAVIYEILNQDPEPLTAIRTGVPLELERIVFKSISKDAATRYQHADDLIADLTAADLAPVSASAPGISAAQKESSDHWDFLRYGVSAILGGVLAILLYSQFKAASDANRSQYVVGMNRITIESDVEMWPTIHPDGDQVVYGAGQLGDMRLFYRLVEGGPRRQLIDDMDAHQAHPSYSPDGNQILFASEGSIYTVGSLGGTPRPVARPPGEQFYLFPSWAPDGERIVFSTLEDTIHIVNIVDNQEVLNIQSRSPHSLSWSPDGRFIAFVSVNLLHARVGTNAAPSSIWILRVEDAESVQVTTNEHMDLSPVWSPDGEYLYYISNQGGGTDVYRREFESLEKVSSHPDERITTGLNLHTIDLSENGIRLVGGIVNYSQNIWAVALDSDRMVSIDEALPITHGNHVVEGIAVSPDETRIAYGSNAKGNSNVFVAPLRGGNPLQITSGIEPDFVYDWSPTGNELAYHKFVDGSRDIYTVSIDDLTETLVSNDVNQDALPIWMGDNETIGFVRDVVPAPKFAVSKKGATGIWGPAEVVIGDIAPAPSWSTVNQLLVYEADYAIKTYNPATGESQVVIQLVNENRSLKDVNTLDPMWSDDGKTIYFASTDSEGDTGFFAVPSSGGEVTQIMSYEGQPRSIGRPTIRGNNIYFTKAEVQSDIWVLDLSDE